MIDCRNQRIQYPAARRDPRRAARGAAVSALIALTVLLLIIPAAGAADKKYDHPLITQTYRLLPDGTAEVEEIRTFRFKGDFSYAFVEREQTGDYGRYRIEYLGVTDADSGTELRTRRYTEGDREGIKWFYTASDETRRFAIRYRIENAVQRYGDVAQFYWKGIEDRHAPLKKIRIRIIPPAPSPDLFKVFVHSGARPGTLEIAGDFSEATIEQRSIPRGSFVELRVLLDPSLFPNARTRVSETYESLLADERRIAETTIRRARKTYALIIGAAVIIAAIIGVYLYLYAKYGREPDVAYDALYEREPPSDFPPSVLPVILTQSSAQVTEMPKGFAATLLECARLGYLEIHEKESEGLLGTGLFRNTIFEYRATDKGQRVLLDKPVERSSDERELTAFEIDVLKVVFNEAGEGSTATSKDIENWGKKMLGKKSNFLHFAEPRAKLLRERFEEEHFALDDEKSESVKNWFRAATIAAGVICIIISFALGVPITMIGGVAVIILGAIIAVPLARRTPEAALEYERWQAFKKFITDFSAMKDASASLLPLWERYLVYATALGVAEKLLENLKLIAHERSSMVPVAAWYHPIATSGTGGVPGSGFASLSSLCSSFSNLSNLSSALSTSTGSGGGFSGGGGGGGGGGCSGAG